MNRIQALIERVGDALIADRHDVRVVDLNGLAKQLGARDVVYRSEQRAHGYTEWTTRGPRVVLATTHSDARRRVTLAHECGHLAIDPILRPESLDDLERDLRRDRLDQAVRQLGGAKEAVQELGRLAALERVCDQLAYELLFPSKLADHLATTDWTLRQLMRCCDSLRVSLSVAVIQVNAAARRRARDRIGVLQLRAVGEDYWLATSVSGLPVTWRGRVAVGRRSSCELFALAPGAAARTTFEISNGWMTRLARVEVLRHASGITALVNAQDLA